MRKTILLVGLVGLVFAWTGLRENSAWWGAPGPREIELTYSARLAAVPDQTKEVDLWIPIAKTGVEQKILRRQIDSPVPYSIREDPEFGNDILHLTLRPPIPQPLEIAIHYRARLLNGGGKSARSPLKPEEKEKYLQPKGLIVIDEEVRRRTRDATAGRPSGLDKARGIYDHVVKNMHYDKTTPGYGRGDTARACRVGRGNCTDFHSLFISMARATQIPSRFKIGFLVPSEPSGTIPGYHCWAEFYTDGKGWVPVDASEAWKHSERVDYYFGGHDPNRFLMSMGRDIQLVPVPKNGPVNIFFYPYVEVDGQPFSGIQTEFRFKDLRQKVAS